VRGSAGCSQGTHFSAEGNSREGGSLAVAVVPHLLRAVVLGELDLQRAVVPGHQPPVERRHRAGRPVELCEANEPRALTCSGVAVLQYNEGGDGAVRGKETVDLRVPVGGREVTDKDVVGWHVGDALVLVPMGEPHGDAVASHHGLVHGALGQGRHFWRGELHEANSPRTAGALVQDFATEDQTELFKLVAEVRLRDPRGESGDVQIGVGSARLIRH